MSSKAALRDRARSEAAGARKDKKPGSVIVHHRKPIHHVPWYRFAIEEDYTQVWVSSGVNIQGETIVVTTATPQGAVTRLLNWRDVREVIVVPPIVKNDTER